MPLDSEVHVVREGWIEKVSEIKGKCTTPIYLCGGSQFAGLLANKGLIDEVWVKINPFVMGDGKPLFSQPSQMKLKLKEHRKFDCGIIEARYNIQKN